MDENSLLEVDWPGGVAVSRDVSMLLSDGTRLSTDIYRPKSDALLPSLLMRLPYDKRIAESTVGYAHPSWYASHGYQVVVQDTRGCFLSEGSFYPFANEGIDGFEAVEWAARLPGSDGRVSTFGSSYSGLAQLLTGIRRPPSLKALCPAFSPSKLFDGWVYNHGIFNRAFIYQWVLSRILEQEERDSAETIEKNDPKYISNNMNLWTDSISTEVDSRQPPYLEDWIANRLTSEFWENFSVEGNYNSIQVPGLHITGWYDIFSRGTINNFIGLTNTDGPSSSQQKLVIGPWTHTPWKPVIDGLDSPTTSFIDDVHIDWLDSVFKTNYLEYEDKPVSAFVQGVGWKKYDCWPPKESEQLNYYLHSAGRAQSRYGDGSLNFEMPNDELPDVLIYEPSEPLLSNGGSSCCSPEVMGKTDQVDLENSRSVLVYSTPPFEKDREFVGNAGLTIYISTDTIDIDLIAKICLVDRAGVSKNIQDGVVRGSLRNSYWYPEKMTPGKVYRLKIDLSPIGVRVSSGEKIRLTISNSSTPRFEINPSVYGPATQHIFHNSNYPSCFVAGFQPG